MKCRYIHLEVDGIFVFLNGGEWNRIEYIQILNILMENDMLSL